MGAVTGPGNRDAVLDVVVEILETDGYDAVRVRDVARGARVSSKSIYKMFESRDELILCHAGDYGGARARRISPFVLEALDQPSVELPLSAGASPPPLERLAAFRAVVPPSEGARAPVTEPLMLSFGAIDAYLTCPAKYRYGHVLRIPVSPHHALIYGSALHTVVQEFHKRHARGYVMTEEELVASFEATWSNEGS